jgi:ubiquinone/menaquinone biosynthesis C-methylase UbiE
MGVPYLNDRKRKLFDFISGNQPKAVLEVGCGEGIALQYLKPLRYVGVDLSFVRLRFASTRYPTHAFIQGDGTNLPVCSEFFDLVFCSGTLHHLPDFKAFEVVKEMKRICKKGGRIALIEPNAYNPSSFLFGLLRKPERGILHCKLSVFLRYFSELGMRNKITFKYDDTSAPMNLFVQFSRKRNFVKTRWFNRYWKNIDDMMKKIIPERFWANIVMVAQKQF